MKQTIRQVLDDMKDSQINLGSLAARETMAKLITTALKSKGNYTEFQTGKSYSNINDKGEQSVKETWVCNVCDENTYDVDSDYITGNTFARVGIVKNPTIYSSETEPFKEQTATALGALKLKPDPGSGVSTTTDTVYPINAQITQKVGIASTAIGYVASWNKDTGILRYYQPVGLTTLTAAGNKLLNFGN